MTTTKTQVRFMVNLDGSGGFTAQELEGKIVEIARAHPYTVDNGEDYSRQPNLIGAAITELLGDDPDNWKGVLVDNCEDVSLLLDQATEDDVEDEHFETIETLSLVQNHLDDKETWGEVAEFLRPANPHLRGSRGVA